MKSFKKKIIIFSSVLVILTTSFYVYDVFADPVIQKSNSTFGRAVDDIYPSNIVVSQEPRITIAASADMPLPNGTRLFIPQNAENKPALRIVVQNFSFTDLQGNFIQNQVPPVTPVKKDEPTPVDVVISSTSPGESGTVFAAIEFSYCAPLYSHNREDRPCIEKNLAISLPQHIVSLNQHFNVTITAPRNIPDGLYQIGIVSRALTYLGDSNQPSNTSVSAPFWIRVN